MSSKRTVLSRPRTRLYDANYNIGESYYKSALDRLDRKYSGRPLSPVRQTTPLNDLAERHARAFADEDIDVSRRRAEKKIKEEHVFDSRGARLNRASLLAENFDGEFNDETPVANRLRNRRKPPVDDVTMESTSNAIKSYRLLDRSDKLLDSVGINDNYAQSVVDKEASQRRRALKVSYDPVGDELTKWTPLESNASSVRAVRREEAVSLRAQNDVDSTTVTSSAAIRARQSKERINDIEEEMAAMAEKQAAREARVARLRKLVAETEQESAEVEVQQSRAERASSKKQKSVHF